jgi:hypothetical protein
MQAVTFFWAISDFLSGKGSSMSLTEDMVQKCDDETLADLVADVTHGASVAALWMLLLVRLTSVTTDQRVELRNGTLSS